ncbi:MAG: MFS transporter [Elusimicrobia bacterium]|nr:MFS transporter [Elusimicrobiota bacterium]
MDALLTPRAPLLLRNRNILLIWAGQALSQGGTRMYQIALAWWIVTTGGGGKEVGLFMVASALPALLFVKLIGKVVDRRPSRSVLIACDLAAFLITAAVAAAFHAGRLGLAGACAMGFLLALAQAFFDPALNKAVASAAAPEDLEAAVAFQSSTQSLASFAGAMAGALLIDRVGIFGVIVLNALSFLVSAGANALLDLPAAAAAGAEEGDGFSVWAALRETPWIKKVLLGFGCVNFFLTPILVVLPLYVKISLRGSASLLGALEVAIWLGILAGTFGSDRLPARGGVKGVLGLGAACMLALGLCLLLPGLIVNRALFLAALFGAGCALGVNNVKFVTLFQERVRPELKGRFFALMQALLSFTFPAAFFLFGLLAELLAPPQVCLVQALGVLALAAYFLSLSKSTEAAP